MAEQEELDIEPAEVLPEDAPLEPAESLPGADQLIGSIIAHRYKVLCLLGQGGMGAVYKVQHLQLKKSMALKLMRQNEFVDEKALRRFDREAKAASSLNHPNLVSVHDYGVSERGAPYLVMDFVDGRSLCDLIKSEGCLEEDLALGVFADICDALAYAHQKRVLHRDIKPGNIMLEGTGPKMRACIVDFGIAKIMPQGDEAAPDLTQTGEVVGSPFYMSPEQCTGQRLDERSDIYSMGCVMFEALMGSPPFGGDNSVQVILKHLNERPPLFKSINKNKRIRPELERVVMQALEKEPGNRYQSMEDLSRDLRLIRSGKNPVKEISNVRRKIRMAATFAKGGLLVALISIVSVWATFSLLLHQTPWQRSTSQAIGQMAIGPANYNQAETLLKRAWREAEDGQAPEADREAILYQFGMLYNADGRHKEAIEQLSRALELSCRHKEDALRGSIYDFICSSNQELGKLDEAAQAGEKALSVKRRCLGDNNQLTANTLFHLGQVYRKLHRYADAEARDSEVLSCELALHPGKDDPCLADAYEQLANVQFDLNKSEQALQNAREALDIRLAVQGREHPFTQKLAKWLIGYLCRHNQRQQAEEIASKCRMEMPALPQ